MKQSQEEEILELLFNYPTKRFSYREIERRTSVSIGSISKYVKSLQRQSLINIEIMPNAKYVTANTENPLFQVLKRISNLKQLYISGLVDYVYSELRPNAIILFGSFAKGEDNERSDIDISVIGGRNKQIDCKIYEKKLKKPINITRTEIRRTTNEFKHTLYNGIVLKGYL